MTWRCLISLGFVVLAAPLGAAAQSPRQPLTASELDKQRGGILTPLGYDVGFGAVVRTTIDGHVALESQLTWTAQGVRTTSSAPAELPLGPALAGTGAGATRVIHDLSENRIASVVLNAADNRTIRQDTSITLTIPRLAELQQQVAADRLTAALQSAVGLAVRDQAGR
jgi:hypothetical protein